jgi:chromosome segregation ATPase
LVAQLNLLTDANTESQALLAKQQSATSQVKNGNTDQKIKELSDEIAKKNLEMTEMIEKFKRVSSDHDTLATKLHADPQKTKTENSSPGPSLINIQEELKFVKKKYTELEKKQSDSANIIKSLTIDKQSIQKELDAILSQGISTENAGNIQQSENLKLELTKSEARTKELQLSINSMKLDSEKKKNKIIDLEIQLETLNDLSARNNASIRKEYSIINANELSMLQKQIDQHIIQIQELNSKLLENQQESQTKLEVLQKSGLKQVLKT